MCDVLKIFVSLSQFGVWWPEERFIGCATTLNRITVIDPFPSLSLVDLAYKKITVIVLSNPNQRDNPREQKGQPTSTGRLITRADLSNTVICANLESVHLLSITSQAGRNLVGEDKRGSYNGGMLKSVFASKSMYF